MQDCQTDARSRLPEPLEVLPAELWIEVIQNMEPRDVLSLSAVCRRFRSILNERGAWVLVLLSLCRREGLFEPSYSIDTMDLEGLQRAALGPYRWGQMIQNYHADDSWNTDDLEPVATAKATDVWAPHLQLHEAMLHLVPGGRFLLTATPGTLRLWDLGPAGTALSTHPHIVSELQWESRTDGVYPPEVSDLTAHIVDERKLRVVLAIVDRISNVTVLSVQVFEISPTMDEASFSRLASIQFDTIPLTPISRLRLWLHSTSVLITFSGTGIFWDFERAHYTVVASVKFESWTASFTGSFITHLNVRSMSFWRLPFKDQFFHPAPPSGSFIDLLGSEEPPPDLIVDLAAPQFGRGHAILQTAADPHSLLIEMVKPLSGPEEGSFARAQSIHRVVIEPDPFDQRQFQVTVYHRASYVAHGLWSAQPRHARVNIPQYSCAMVMGLGRDYPARRICLRTVSLSGGNSTNADNLVDALTTVICSSSGFGALTFCPASGRAALRSNALGPRDLYFYDYLAWGIGRAPARGL